jgi:hypothetical protein
VPSLPVPLRRAVRSYTYLPEFLASLENFADYPGYTDRSDRATHPRAGRIEFMASG